MKEIGSLVKYKIRAERVWVQRQAEPNSGWWKNAMLWVAGGFDNYLLPLNPTSNFLVTHPNCAHLGRG